MAPREVNVYTSGWRATGVNVQVPQYELVVRFEWVDNAGVSHTGKRTVKFPNVLAQMPAEYVAERMKDVLLDYARLNCGVDT